MNRELRITSEEKQASSVNRVNGSVSDEALILAVQGGARNAFGQLVRRHQKRLFRFIYAMTRSFDQTEDIVQDAFVRAFNAMDSFKPGHAFYPWLSRIARNLALNQISREEKKESLDNMVAAGFEPASGELGPFDRLLEGEAARRFYAAVKAMPTKYRTVFALRHFEGLDYAEIAAQLKIPPGTVDSRLYRARQFLLEALKDLL
ncbi:MAG: sigma-70 family RNA polymerase sigma factor [Candidatus Zixiibacteriota bacterium]|nr:MAG: sigma-70 family RNA polymerase sigma factor [candidate division Zixibacteria bacterium]